MFKIETIFTFKYSINI